MPRYIDLEELAKRINENIKPENLEEKALIEWCKDECIRQGYAMPTADVVPRSEVEFFKLILQELNATIVEQEKDCETAKAEATKEAAKKIFAEVDKIIDEIYNRHIFGNNDLDDIKHEAVMNFSADISYRIDELKEKYNGREEE